MHDEGAAPAAHSHAAPHSLHTTEPPITVPLAREIATSIKVEKDERFSHSQNPEIPAPHSSTTTYLKNKAQANHYQKQPAPCFSGYRSKFTAMACIGLSYLSGAMAAQGPF
jgi:hypothetical protein